MHRLASSKGREPALDVTASCRRTLGQPSPVAPMDSLRSRSINNRSEDRGTNRYFYVPVQTQVAQTVKNLPAMQETWVRSLGRENPLEKGMATCSGMFAGEIPWTEEPGGLQSMELQRVGHDCAN